MRINELIVESNNLDEISLAGIGKGLGKAATGIGKTVGATLGGARALGTAAKAGYKSGSQGAQRSILGQVLPDVNLTGTPSSATDTQQTTTGTPPSGDSSTGNVTDPASLRKQAASLNRQADQIEKTQAAAPAAAEPVVAPASTSQSLDLDQLKKDREAKQAAGVVGQQQAQQQMAATQQANTAAAGQDAAIKAAAAAAKAKPPFQQTAADKLAIKAAADKGIREAVGKKKLKKKKTVAEFKSNFLGMTI